MTERDKIIAAANEAVASAPDARVRSSLIAVFVTLLMKAGTYKGFNYTYWLERGHAAWIEAGRPNDNTPFLGDQTQVRFY